MLTAAIVEGILLVATGRFLERNEHAPFVLVIATITAAFFPLGTVLGGVTLWRVISHTASGSPRE